MDSNALIKLNVPNLEHVKGGKIREIYDLGSNLLIVATDRISAFDVILPDGIPGKGKILTGLSAFWFNKLGSAVPNHLVSTKVDDLPASLKDMKPLAGRIMIVRKARPFAFECIVRGYLLGNGYKEYASTGRVSGIKLPPGLREGDKLEEPIFTPTTKASGGAHDEPVPFDKMVSDIGEESAVWLRDRSIALYKTGLDYADSRGIIIADTKFEFGTTDDGFLLIDECLTPDSSRFWPAESYSPGKPGVSLDKQYVRDFLSQSGWDKKPPAPRLPQEVINETMRRYEEIRTRLIGPTP